MSENKEQKYAEYLAERLDETISWKSETYENFEQYPSFVLDNKGYHLTDFPKGELGKISKIEEELNELKDAESQNSKVMILIELSDLYGALEEYCFTQGVTMEDLKIFSNITKRAFKNGCRK